MNHRKLLGAFLSVAMAVPSGANVPANGTIKGVVSISGAGLDGVTLTLVNVETGKTFAVKSTAGGSFSALVPAGSYVVSSPGRSGVSIARAPLTIEVASGRVASANIELASLAAQQGTAPTGTMEIKHESVDCITEGEFTEINASFEPAMAVVNGKLYFQSNLSPEWFYTEFEKIDPPGPGGSTHKAFIPKVNKDGGIETITYYIQVTSSDFAENKTKEQPTTVVSGAAECKGRLAAIGRPDGAVSVLSASGGAAGSALSGFGGIAGAGLATGAVVAGVAGAAAAGAGLAAATGDDATPTPAPTPIPATPTPTVPPTPVPVATCTVTLRTSPVTAADPSVGGRFCTANVVSTIGGNLGVQVEGVRTFSVPCAAAVRIFANVAAQSSIAGPLPAEWSNSCSGSALGRPCVLDPVGTVAGTERQVGLTCGTR